jgi:hypothetical protein
MSKFKNAMKTIGEVADAMVKNQKKVEDMTNILMQKTYGLELEQAKKVAHILVTQADVTWKY